VADEAVAARTSLVPRAPPSSLRRGVGLAVGLGAAVFVLAALSTWFTHVAGQVAAVWPANAIAVAALLRASDRDRWFLLAGAFAGNALANLSGGDALASAFGVSFADAIEELMCVVLMRRTCGPSPDLTSVDHLVRFVFIGGLLAPLTSGLLALPALVRPGQAVGSSLLAWFAADSLGMLIVVPAVMAFNVEGLRRQGGSHFGRVAAPLMAVAIALAAINVRWIYPLQFLLLPSLLFCAVRLGASAAAIAQLTVSAVVVVTTLTGIGGIAFGDDILERLRAVQAFLAMQSLVVLPASAVLQDRLRLEADLRAAKDVAEASAHRARTELTSRLSAERRLDLALKAGGIGAFELDVESDQVAVDQHMFELLGLEPVPGGWLSMQTVRAGLNGRDLRRLVSAFERLREAAAGDRSGGAGASVAFDYNRRDGEVRRLQLHAGVYPGETARLRVFGALIDITEQTQAEEERALLRSRLQKAEHMRRVGALAGGIAHDFNNLLGAIQGFSSLLEDDLPAASAQHRFATRITASAERGKEIVGQILSYARSGEQARKAIALDLFLAEAQPLLESLAGAHVTLIIVCRDPGLRAAASPAQLTQVLSNLCKNAGDAMDGRPGEVAIELYRVAGTEVAGVLDRSYRPTAQMVGQLSSKADYACIRVSDTGPGIASAVLRRMFEPFFTSKDRGRGTGLGLAVVQGAAEDHGGACLAESDLGAGAAFSFLLPLAPAVAAGARGDPAGRMENRGGAVMVVDDEPNIAEALVTALNRAGYDAVGVDNAAAALEAVTADPAAWRLLITDQIMPDMRGADLARACKGLKPSLVTVLYSGFNDDLNGQDSSVFDLTLAKPLTTQDFIRELDALAARGGEHGREDG
jgi:signal transduction histidine kinase/integral membrane sensor domain MASE1/CheY-like chemotaxis protein